MKFLRLLKILVVSCNLAILSFAVYCFQYMLLNNDVDKSVCGFCGTCILFSIIILCIVSTPFGVSNKDEFYAKYEHTDYWSRTSISYLHIGLICSVVFYIVNFDDKEVCTDFIWDTLGIGHMQLVILKCLPKFYRNYIYVPLTTGAYISDSRFFIEILQFGLLLILAGITLTKFINYQAFLMLRNKYGEES